MPEDDMLSLLRAHFRTGERDKETMIVGAEGVIGREVSKGLDNALTARIKAGGDALKDVAVATLIACAAARAIMSDEMELEDDFPLEDVVRCWSTLQPRARRMIAAVLNISIIETSGQADISGDNRDKMIAEMTTLALDQINQDPLTLLLDYALMDGCVAAWDFQRQQKELKAAQAAAKAAPQTIEIGALTPVDDDQEETETAAPAPPVRRKVQDRPRRGGRRGSGTSED